MAKYTLKRLIMAILTLLLVACLTFLLMNSIPGSPWVSEKAPSQATLDALNAKYGLDKPLIVQLGKYLENILKGDLGVSLKMQQNRPVLDIIKEMFPVSAKIGVFALLWAILVGVPLGCLAAYNRGKWLDSLLRIICTIGVSMPSFVVASLLLTGLAVTTSPCSRPYSKLLSVRSPMCCRALHWAYTRCAISPVRRALPCLTHWDKTISRLRERRDLKTPPLSLSTLCETHSSPLLPTSDRRSPLFSAVASLSNPCSPYRGWDVILFRAYSTVTIPL